MKDEEDASIKQGPDVGRSQRLLPGRSLDTGACRLSGRKLVDPGGRMWQQGTGTAAGGGRVG